MIHPHRSNVVYTSRGASSVLLHMKRPGCKHHTSDEWQWTRPQQPTIGRVIIVVDPGRRGVSCCKSEHPDDDDKKPTRSTDPGRGWRKLATFSQRRRLSWPACCTSTIIVPVYQCITMNRENRKIKNKGGASEEGELAY
jgi:hypothetical protein